MVDKADDANEEVKESAEPKAAETIEEKTNTESNPKEKIDSDTKEEEKEESGPSGIPDLAELGRMAQTMYNSIKSGVKEVAANYKKKRQQTDDKKD